ncbi:MAG TPA: hypothetical protein VE907_07100 [Gammaproteobacteria bacterium]|nr:hypothetical protein [Gammaproteobacteria bacterium]
MTVQIGEMVSEVSVEAAPTAATAAPPTEWQELARLRDARAQLARDAWRTAAEGFDD